MEQVLILVKISLLKVALCEREEAGCLLYFLCKKSFVVLESSLIRQTVQYIADVKRAISFELENPTDIDLNNI
jgi:hypothetical protein